MNKILVVFLLLTLTIYGESESIADSVVVTATVDDIELSLDAGYSYVDIDNTKGQRSIAEILRSVPGVTSAPIGGVGNYETVSIRGVSGSRIAVFLDGVPLQSSMGGAVDLSRFSAKSLEGIEVYKGITPARFGGNSLGGVINLVSKKGDAESSRMISLMMGSFHEYRGTVQLFEPRDSLSFRGFIDYHSGDNNYPYLDRNSTPYNLNDDKLEELKNNRSANFVTQIGMHRELTKLNLDIDWTHRTKTLELPATEGLVNHTALFSGREERLIASVSHTVNDISLYHVLSGIYQENEIFWTGLDNFGVAHGTISGEDWAALKSESMIGEYSVLYQGMVGNRLGIDGRVSGRFEQMIPSAETTVDGLGEWKSNRLSGGNATDLSLYLGRITTILGGSITAHRSFTEGGENRFSGVDLELQSTINIDWSSRLGVNAYFNDGAGSVFANGALYSKVPTIRQLYGYSGAILPNPDLDREEGVTSELGVSHKSDKIAAEVTFFYNYFPNMIVNVSDGRISRADNMGENRSMGIEQTLFWQLSRIFSISESITFQNTENRKKLFNGNKLPNQPQFSLFTDLNIEPTTQTLLSIQTSYESILYRDFENRLPYPSKEGSIGSFNISLYASWNKEWITIGGGVRNIFDGRKSDDSEQTLESGYYGTLYPGRVFNLEMKFIF